MPSKLAAYDPQSLPPEALDNLPIWLELLKKSGPRAGVARPWVLAADTAVGPSRADVRGIPFSAMIRVP